MATFQTGGYPAPLPGFNTGYYTPQSPYATGHGHYYPSSRPAYGYPTTPNPKGHTRRATGDGFNYPQTTPLRNSYAYAPQEHYSSAPPKQSSRRPDYVSNSERVRESTHTYRVPADKYSGYPHEYTSHEHYYSTRPRPGEDFVNGRSDEYLPRYEQFEPRPPPYYRDQSYREPPTDHRYYDQERVYTAAAHPTGQSHNRRASFTAQYSSSRPTPSKPAERPSTGYGHREKPSSRGKREATEADALRHKIPAGFSIKFWDPNEEPILLLGSVFDADSLGKWIYDWAAHFYGAASPLAEEAGELWVLLIELSHKIKLAEEVMNRVRSSSNRDLLEEFLDSGERIWQRFSKLLKICENSMWETAKRDCANAPRVTMGKNSGLAFVEAMFDRDCELRTTEKLMQHIRTWVMRYDANCVPILHDPRA